MISAILNWLSDVFLKITNAIIGFLSTVFGYLFEKLIDFLKILFTPIFALIGIIFYIFYKAAELVLTLLELFLGIGKLFFSLVKGIFLTLSGFTFTAAATPDNGEWTSIFNNIVDGLEFMQIDIIAYILIFLIWFSFGFAAIRSLSSIRGGN